MSEREMRRNWQIGPTQAEISLKVQATACVLDMYLRCAISAFHALLAYNVFCNLQNLKGLSKCESRRPLQ